VKLERKYSLFLIALAYLSFVSLGLPDGLNGVAWPSIRGYFDLPLDALGSLLVMFTAGYLVSSFSSGRLLALMSLGSMLALSCLATAVSLIGYALAPAWWVMVALGALAGLGAGAIDAGLNTFAATQFSARIVNWLHACYGAGAASGPVIMTRVLEGYHPWQRGYAIVGVWQLLLAICFGLTRRRWPKAAEHHVSSPIARTPNITTLKLPAMWLSIAVFFVYTGIEASAGIWAYSMFTEARGVPMVTAGTWVSVYWGALTVGRLLAGVVVRQTDSLSPAPRSAQLRGGDNLAACRTVGFVSANRLLRCCTAGMALGAALIWLNITSQLSFLGLGLMGLASAPIFPSLIATTPARLGSAHTSNGVGFQIAAAVLGQALLPAFIGVLAGKLGVEVIGPALFVAAVMLLVLVQALTSVRQLLDEEPLAKSQALSE
jgi:fucose permease